MPQKQCCVAVVSHSASLEFNVKPKTETEKLLDEVKNTCSLREIYYFGLGYTNPNGTNRWVNPKERIRSYGSSKDTHKSFKLMIRCYPEDVSELVEDNTKLLFYLELKNQILTGRLYCSPEYALLLASFQVIVNLGTYDPNSHHSNYFDPEKYFPKHVLEQHNLTDEEWGNKVAELHKSHGEMMREVAIEEYLKVVQDLDMYGITYFPIKNKKGSSLFFGIDAVGLTVYEHDNKITPKISFPWKEIRNIAYSKKKFIVKPVDPNVSNLAAYCDSMDTAKEMLLLCSANIDMFHRRRLPDSMELQQMKNQAAEVRHKRQQEWDKLFSERKARKEAEQRCVDMERAVKEQEMAYEYSQSIVSDFQHKVRDLETQLEEEKRLRMELQAMQRHLEKVNERLEQESTQSIEERTRLAAERDDVMEQILRQQEMIEHQRSEQQLTDARFSDDKSSNEDAKESDERELLSFEGIDQVDENREVRAVVDVDYAKRIQLLKKDLEATRDDHKLQSVDIQYEENVRLGMDKYRTLRNIRSGNTKKRVEQFESM